MFRVYAVADIVALPETFHRFAVFGVGEFSHGAILPRCVIPAARSWPFASSRASVVMAVMLGVALARPVRQGFNFCALHRRSVKNRARILSIFVAVLVRLC